MATHLQRKGHPTFVWNRSVERRKPLREVGATVCESIAEVGSNTDLVMICVNRTEDVLACVDSLVQTLPKGSLIVDHSTISPPGAVEIAETLARHGQRFIDAPITGGSMGAIQGTLTIFCGGDAKDFEEVTPILGAYAKRCEHVGAHGAGQLTKMANQIAVGGALIGLCESLAFAQRAGLDLALTRELLSGGAAGSWAFDHYGPKILSRDWSPGFSVKNQRKDFAYCLEAAEKIGLDLPGTDLVDALLERLERSGRGEDATAALFEVLLNP